MKKAIIWFAGFLQDQGNSASSKRLIAYICTYYLYMIVRDSLKGAKVDLNVLLVVGGVILFSIGAIASEFITNNWNKK